MDFDNLINSEPTALALVDSDRIKDFFNLKKEFEEKIGSTQSHITKGRFYFNIAKLYHHCPLTYHSCFPDQSKHEYLKAIMQLCYNAHLEFETEILQIRDHNFIEQHVKACLNNYLDDVKRLLRLQLPEWNLRDPFLLTTENIFDAAVMHDYLRQKSQMCDIVRPHSKEKLKKNLCTSVLNTFYKTTQYMMDRCCKPHRLGFFNHPKPAEAHPQVESENLIILRLDK